MTLIQSIKYHGSRCKWCRHFADCEPDNRAQPNQEYCKYSDNRFEVAREPAMDETPIFHQMEEGGELE